MAVGTGFHLPKMSAASAMNPRPAVMLRENDEARNTESEAPPVSMHRSLRIIAVPFLCPSKSKCSVNLYYHVAQS